MIYRRPDRKYSLRQLHVPFYASRLTQLMLTILELFVRSFTILYNETFQSKEYYMSRPTMCKKKASEFWHC